MEEAIEVSVSSPTSEDNMKNRFREFVLYGAIEFNQAVATQILISTDKNNTKSSKGAKYIGKVVEVSVTGTGLVAGLGQITKPIGIFTGEVMKQIVTTYDKNLQHKNSKKIEKLLEGFDPEDEQWMKYILDSFCDIFIQ